jgi:transcriptional regulatory protein LEU3
VQLSNRAAHVLWTYNEYSLLTTLSDHFFLLSVRLHVQCFYFFLPRSNDNNKNLVALYTLACTVVDTAVELDDTEDITSSATALFSKNLHLAAFSILRITRSHLGESLGLSKGQKAYFSVIQLHRKMSVQHNDLASRATIIFTQLWTSADVFKQADGTTDSLMLCCRTRLAMSVVFDCFWRWRREFAGQSHPYERKDDGNSKPRIAVYHPMS